MIGSLFLSYERLPVTHVPSLLAELFYPLIISGVTSLIVGAALLLVWRHHRAQRYVRDLGVAHLAQALMPLGYCAAQFADVQSLLRFGILMVVAAGQIAYFIFMSKGISRMSRRFAARALRRNCMFIAPAVAVAIGLNGNPVASAWLSPVAGVLLGVAATAWLRGGNVAERALGPVLILLGASQAAFPIWGDAGVPWQSGIGTILRVVMALVLVYATLENSKLQSQSLQHRLFQLVERSHQGVLVFDGAVVLYAN